MTEANIPGWVIAIDGGGTKIAVAAQKVDWPNTELPIDLTLAKTWQHAGTGSAHPTTWLTASKNLHQALQAALDSLADDSPIHCIYLALAGAGRVEDQQRVVQFVRESLASTLSSSTKVHCTGDIDPLLDVPDESELATLAIILGTGSVVAARDAAGLMVRAGGWGPLLGDECSAGAIGLAALQRVTQTIDSGREPLEASRLVRAIVDELRTAYPSTPLNNLIIETAADRTRRAQLSLVVAQLAFGQNDAEALQIIDHQIQRLVDQIQHVARRLGSQSPQFHLLFSGGLVTRCPALAHAITDQCRRSLTIDHSSIADPLLATLRSAVARREGECSC